MRPILATGLALTLGLCMPAVATAQERRRPQGGEQRRRPQRDTGTNEEKKAKKLAEPFMAAAAWITDYDKAREEANTTGKLIFAYFTRSYAY